MLTLVKSLLSGRSRQAGRPNLPMLDGFSDGASLRLPAGEIFAQEGVRLSSDPVSGNRVVPLCGEAWVAGRQNHGNAWYALWCPHAARWEILSFEVPEATPDTGRRPGQARRRGNAGH